MALEPLKQHNRPISSHLVDMTTVAKPKKLWLYLVCFNSQIIKRIAYFDDLHLSWEYKVCLNFAIC